MCKLTWQGFKHHLSFFRNELGTQDDPAGERLLANMTQFFIGTWGSGAEHEAHIPNFNLRVKSKAKRMKEKAP